ncbi:hypothetical protein SAMN02745206_01212 [Desulfacinum infernum DSM 9756]|uniref:Uncharacterized protein n=1 Tax=Desulfacinum infernum DSM 9756 TaxID=1121391 RepID=A0A1M4YBF8_9BACT|nr:hypothetical protein SAMN02745206_01212 [Desulfacinum infernum DSM 9756]
MGAYIMWIFGESTRLWPARRGRSWMKTRRRRHLPRGGVWARIPRPSGQSPPDPPLEKGGRSPSKRNLKGGQVSDPFRAESRFRERPDEGVFRATHHPSPVTHYPLLITRHSSLPTNHGSRLTDHGLRFTAYGRNAVHFISSWAPRGSALTSTTARAGLWSPKKSA